ncbi:hypothetical protein RGF97_20845 [Streptomyces roseicoloratus]|uniref:Lipoprotein n=1 Tax=Streptomyces roseicoloratus TaxID=2508722 RepID=A0ABY9RX81_9ACTN|nr:hypothetical protein [Streptomyces roseicoloratus]WMX46779.1 hypothetical protein RGF97_20845 [Streptomyces roseicoloratus]
MAGAACVYRKTGLLVAGALALAACGQGQEHRPRVTAQEQCDGTISAAAAPALKRAVVTEGFTDAPTGWLDETAAKLREDYAKRAIVSLGTSECVASADRPRNHLSVEFGVYRERSLGTYSGRPYMYPYDMGEEAQVGYRWTVLYVRCTSDQLKGSDRRPARFRGILVVEESSTPDTAATREDNLVILHSVALALVRKLGCVNDAGLPSTPVIKPLKPAKVWPPGPI